MDRRSFAAAVTLGSAAALFGAQRASAAPPTDAMPRARNVVLVHGAYADGSCWSDVIPYLQARGLNVASVQNPLRTLDEDCDFARRTLALMDGPTVLAAHSYSGMIATEVGVDPKVRRWFTSPPAHPTPARTTPRSPRSTRRPRRVQVW